MIAVTVLSLISAGTVYWVKSLRSERDELVKVEWLYRYERGLYRDMNTVMHRERLMLYGTTHEVDSLKSLIRHHEQRTCADTTYTYYYPSKP